MSRAPIPITREVDSFPSFISVIVEASSMPASSAVLSISVWGKYLSQYVLMREGRISL